VGLGNDVGAPEVPYMGYVKRKYEETEEERIQREKEEEEKRKLNDLKSRSRRLTDEAWELKEERRYNEALIFVNRALEIYDGKSEPWNVKAIILDELKLYEEALENYDIAIEINPTSENLKHNKISSLMEYSELLRNQGRYSEALDRVNESLKIYEQTEDNEFEDKAWNLKGTILEKLNDTGNAFNCYKKAIELADDNNENKKTYKENRDRLLPLIDNSDIVCPKCGNKVKVTDNFCLRCGFHIDEPIKVISKNESKSNHTRRKYDHTTNELIIDIDED
jgi:tetratricopeptide (TPR) repeat protein